MLPALLLAAVILPADAGQPNAGQTATQSQSSAEMSPAFKHDMQTMCSETAKLRATKDPEQRAKLLDEHMRTMQAAMQTMMNSGAMNGGEIKGGSMSAHGSGMMGGGAAGKSGMMDGGATGKGGMMSGGGMASGSMMQMMQHPQAIKSLRCQ